MLQVLTPEPESREGSTPESEAESNPKRNFTPLQGENLSEDSMKRVFLLMVIPALLVALGFAQTPAPSVNTDQTTIKGCLGGSDGNYTVVQDNTGRIFKITTSIVDLKPHVGHDVTLIGQKASGVSSAAADNSFAVTQLNMISEHCAAAGAAAGTAPSATVSAPPGTNITPAATAPAAAPAATAAAPAASVTAPTETAATPADTVITPAAPAAPTAAPATSAVTPAETVVTPAAPAAASSATPAQTAVTPTADATAPPAIVTPPAETDKAVESAHTVSTPVEAASTPKADAAQPTHLRAHSRKRSAPAAAAAIPPAATSSASSKTSPASAPAPPPPAATAKTSAEPVSAPVAAATTPTRRGSLWLLISLAALVIVIGVMVPSLSRWRKRKSLERTGAPNLSLMPVASSTQNKADQPRKAA